MPCLPPGLKEKNVFYIYLHFPLFRGGGLLRKVYTKIWICMRGCYIFGRPGIHDEGMQDSWPPCFLHTGASSNWACGTDGGADGDAGANLWFGNVELVCFVISSVSYYEGFLLLDVVGCYCCCWCWWWWHRKRTGRSSERNHKNEKVGTEEETEDPNRQKWTRKNEQRQTKREESWRKGESP